MNMNLSIAKKALPLAAVVMMSACQTADVYTTESFADYQTTHKEVAVLPFKVTIGQKKLPEDVDLEALASMEKEEGVVFQKQLY